MTFPRRLRPDDPLALSAGALPRLGWAVVVSAVLWGAVLWAMSGGVAG